jgi:hypothetical protein
MSVNKARPLIGVIAGAKATDALLCASLERAGFRLKIIQYKIPIRAWIPWVLKRIQERGFGVFIGHICLAGWLRLERLIESARGKSVWADVLSQVPSWKDIQTQRKLFLNERAMISDLEDTDAIIFLDSFRLSHRFFRSLDRPCFQVVWGDAPEYLGDSGGYWAYTHGDLVSVGLVDRRGQFDELRPVKRIPVLVNKHETLRTVKVKQAVALSEVLPNLLSHLLETPPRFTESRKTECRVFYAPTLWTYLRGPSSRVFPRYAFRSRPCTLFESDKSL